MCLSPRSRQIAREITAQKTPRSRGREKARDCGASSVSFKMAARGALWERPDVVVSGNESRAQLSVAGMRSGLGLI